MNAMSAMNAAALRMKASCVPSYVLRSVVVRRVVETY